MFVLSSVYINLPRDDGIFRKASRVLVGTDYRVANTRDGHKYHISSTRVFGAQVPADPRVTSSRVFNVAPPNPPGMGFSIPLAARPLCRLTIVGQTQTLYFTPHVESKRTHLCTH